MNFTPEQIAFRDSVRRFFAVEAEPHLDRWEAEGLVEPAFWLKAGEAGRVTHVVCSPRHAGMTMLITPTRDMKTRADLPGIQKGRKLPKLGYRGIDTGEFGFAGYECDADLCLVGGQEGQGFFGAAVGN